MTKALDVQIGGSHYKDLKIQPIEYIRANNLGFFEGNIIKYVTRWRSKNGVEDLKKVIHYAQMLIEFEEKENGSSSNRPQRIVSKPGDCDSGVGVPSVHSRRADDTPSIQPEWAKFPGRSYSKEPETPPSVPDILREECARYEQQGSFVPDSGSNVQSPMGDVSVRGSSIMPAYGENWTSQAMGQSTLGMATEHQGGGYSN